MAGFGWKDELLLREAAAVTGAGQAQACPTEEPVVMAAESWRTMVDSTARMADENARLRQDRELKAMMHDLVDADLDRRARRAGKWVVAAVLALVFGFGMLTGGALMTARRNWSAAAELPTIEEAARWGR